jgi:subtilisin family serine protease
MVLPGSHRKGARTRAKKRSSTVLGVELLESRTLLDAAPVPQLLVTLSSGEFRTVRLESWARAHEALAAWRADPQVQAVEIDQRVSIGRTPDDPMVASQWALNNTGQSGGLVDADIDATEAWDRHTGDVRTAVAVIDTGIDYTHPDLYKNIWLNQREIPVGLNLVDVDGDGWWSFWDLNAPVNAGKVHDANANGRIDGYDVLHDPRWANGRDDDGNGKIDDLIGWDFVDGDNDPFDENGHGTHVAGTIGAIGDNGQGVAGVAWQVSLVALRFLDRSGNGYVSGAVDALQYAISVGVKISNNSWGGGYSSALAAAIGNAQSAGHIFVAAAGNSAGNNDSQPFYPASFSQDNVVAVAATDRFDQLASFSNYGATSVDLAAPGVAILSTTPNGTYSTYSGTSMAAPHVTGTIALLWSAQPGLNYRQVIARIKSGVDRLSSLAGKVASGGRLNAAKALDSASLDMTGPRVVSAVPNGVASVSSVRLTFSEPIHALTFTAADISQFTGPKGKVAVQQIKPVAGSNNTQFDVVFAAQTVVGTYQFDVGPFIADVAGNLMDQNGNGVQGEATDAYRAVFRVAKPSTKTFTNAKPVPIYDFAYASSTITVSSDILVTDVNVKLNISHTYDADLLIYLLGPDGTRVNLVANRGGSGKHFKDTTLNDEASRPVRQGAAPFSGAYRPEQPLAAFDGKNARGDWTLVVLDGYSNDTGKLNSWSLIVSGIVGTIGQAAAGTALSPRAVDAAMAPQAVPRLATSAPLAPWPSQRSEQGRCLDLAHRVWFPEVVQGTPRTSTGIAKSPFETDLWPEMDSRFDATLLEAAPTPGAGSVAGIPKARASESSCVTSLSATRHAVVGLR